MNNRLSKIWSPRSVYSRSAVDSCSRFVIFRTKNKLHRKPTTIWVVQGSNDSYSSHRTLIICLDGTSLACLISRGIALAYMLSLSYAAWHMLWRSLDAKWFVCRPWHGGWKLPRCPYQRRNDFLMRNYHQGGKIYLLGLVLQRISFVMIYFHLQKRRPRNPGGEITKANERSCNFTQTLAKVI